MGRPRKDQQGPSATTRIMEAFWEMLAEMPYGDIGIVALSRRAKVSPNTLYYHFDGLADIASRALAATLDRSIVRSVLSGGSFAQVFEVADSEARLARIRLMARAGSLEHRKMLKESLMALWLEEAGISPDQLSDAEAIELDFIFAGVVALLASDAPSDRWQSVLATLFSRPLGQGIVATMRALQL